MRFARRWARVTVAYPISRCSPLIQPQLLPEERASPRFRRSCRLRRGLAAPFHPVQQRA